VRAYRGILVLGFLAGSVAVGGCGGDGSSSGPTPPVTGGTVGARLRVVNVAPRAPVFDLVLDGARPVLDPLMYGASSGYLSVLPGAHRFEFLAAGATDRVFEAAGVSVREGEDETLFAVGVYPASSLLIVTDDNRVPAAGMARLRIIHGSATVGNVDVYVTAAEVESLSGMAPTLAGRVFRDVADYLEVPAGFQRIRVTLVGDALVVMDTGPILYREGDVLTGVVLDSQKGARPRGILLLRDRP
jgi:hypothetical protein